MKTWRVRENVGKLVMVGCGLASGIALIFVVTTSVGAFTDKTQAGLGALGAVGGSYDVAFLDSTNTVVQGNPTVFAIDTTGVAKVLAGTMLSSAKIAANVVTTTTATGPVVLHLYNAFSGTRPTDPGYAGAGVDPYNVALFSVWVDGTQVANSVTATSFNTTGYTIVSWAAGVSKKVEVQMMLPNNLGNPYYFNRSLVLGLQFDGST